MIPDDDDFEPTAADDMLDGTVCSECGVFFDDILAGAESPGYPRVCRSCGGESQKPRRRSKGKRS